jgi:hypothetical protein
VLKKPFIILNLDIKPSKVKLKELDNINVNVIKELNNTMLDILVKLDNITV